MSLTVLSVGYPLAKISENTAGGAEQVLAMLDEALVRHGHRSLVLAPVGSRCHGLLIPAQIPSGVLDDQAKRQARQSFRHLLNRILEHYSVDLIHMHGLDFAEYMPHGNVPVVVTLHLPLSWYNREALRTCDRGTVLVSVSKTQARTAPPGVHIEKIIPNGIDLDRFRPSKKKGTYAVAMGRICPAKGFHLALDAAEQAGVKLIIAGKVFHYPEHHEYFETQVRPRLSQSARFIGPVGGARKSQLLAGAKCLLVPSLAPETSSLVAMEALASGTPVIASRVGALEEIVNHGKTGFLVRSAEEMPDAIALADSISPDVCRREAEQRFSAETMSAEYLNLYRSVLASAKLPELQAA
jgi:glycosyltransferase involved in cell wall biosynthesis